MCESGDPLRLQRSNDDRRRNAACLVRFLIWAESEANSSLDASEAGLLIGRATATLRQRFNISDQDLHVLDVEQDDRTLDRSV